MSTPTPTPAPTPTELVAQEPRNLAFLGERYGEIQVLGKGGMGCVYKAFDNVLQKWVAVKVLLSSDQNSEAIIRFQQEAKAASRLNHSNIVTVYDFGIGPDGQLYLVMELVEGESLSSILESVDQLKPEDAIPIVSGICEGLAHAHEKGVIHRDLKPSNIVLSKEGKVNIVDFGIAKISQDESEQFMTRTGVIMGSPSYMAPEQINGENPDRRSDLYSLGCIMFKMLTGELPFKGETAVEIMQLQFSSPAPKLNEVGNLVFFDALEDIVGKLLEKDVDRRFQTAQEVEAALSAVEFNQTLESEENRSEIDQEIENAKSFPIVKIAVFITIVFCIFLGMFGYQFIKQDSDSSNLETKSFSKPTSLNNYSVQSSKKTVDLSSFEPYSSVDGDTLSVIYGKGSQLKHLCQKHDLRGVVHVKLEDYTSIGGNLVCFENLPIEQLTLVDVSLLPDFGETLVKFPSLKYLSISSCTGMDKFDYSKLAELRKLQYLSLRYLFISDRALEAISEIKSLTFLNFHASNGFSSTGINKLSRLKNLSCLELGKRQYSSKILQSVVSHPALTTLSLKSTKISDKEVLHLKKINPDLNIEVEK